MAKKIKCPLCGSNNVAKILYGMPAFDEKLEKQLESGVIALGGCCISELNPRFHCNECKKDFGANIDIAGLRSNVQDYKISTCNIKFYVGSFFDGYVEIEFNRNNEGCFVEVRPSLLSPQEFDNAKLGKQPFPFEKWTNVVDCLYDKLFLIDWKKSYNDPHILDGEQWGLEIKLDGKKVRNFHGSNAYPIYWRESLNLFRPFFIDAGVVLSYNK